MLVRVDISAEDLAATHFAISPLFETIEALRTLRNPGCHALHLPWVRWARHELAKAPLELPRVWPLLVEPDRQPEFLMPAPMSRLPDLDEELDSLVATTTSNVSRTLARTFPNQPPPAARALASHPRRELLLIAAEIEHAFVRLVEPHWERVRNLLEADIIHRANTVAHAGAAVMFEQLHSGISWHGDHVLFADASGIEGDPQRAAVGQGGLVLEPSVFIWPNLYIKRWTTTRTTVRYPTRGVGVLWDADSERVPDALEKVLGERRAQLLILLRAPHTTTDLARRLHITASAVSQQLAPLRASGLITTERLGRHRLHMTTALGAQLAAHVREAAAPPI